MNTIHLTSDEGPLSLISTPYHLLKRPPMPSLASIVSLYAWWPLGTDLYLLPMLL